MTRKATPMDLAKSMEKFNLDKKTLIAILAALKKRWRKNARANAGYIAAATALQGALILTPNYVVAKFWGDFLLAVRYIEQLNAYHADDADFDIKALADIMIPKIESGELFGDGDDG